MDRVEQLCRAAQDGDRDAASELVELFYAKIFGYFRRLCGQEEDAADLTQKTFRKVWLSLSSYGNRSSFSTWLHAIAHHVYVDWRRIRPAPISQSDDWWDLQPDSGSGPFETAVKRDVAAHVYAIVEKLDEDVRETVHLHYYQGLTLDETAQALAIAVSTVKYRLQRGLEFLRHHVEQPTRTTS
jgi:RNA polymerase sigma-70 factor, ECF subfamily